MNELINVTEKNGSQVVSARDLYNFLEIKTDFIDWCNTMFEYGFKENEDYTVVLKSDDKPISKSNIIDYVLILSMAREILIVQPTEKGKQARKELIEREKQLRSGVSQLSRKEIALMVIKEEEELELKNQQS